MKRKVIPLILLSVLIITSSSVPNTIAQIPPDPDPVLLNDRIELGLRWLVIQQDYPGAGNWPGGDTAARTAFALIKLQDRAYELGYTSPFDPAYPYSSRVDAGWAYLFRLNFIIYQQTIIGQTNGNPDTNGNDFGFQFSTGAVHPVYTTGVALMALEASGTPYWPNQGGFDLTGPLGLPDGNPDTFQEIAQEATDWLAYAQVDTLTSRGGWFYGPSNNADGLADQSNTGYAVLGLAAAEDFGCIVPAFVKTELDLYITAVQDLSGTYPQEDGGSVYYPPIASRGWINELKTGNLIFEMKFVGDTPTTDIGTRFGRAMEYIVRRWQDPWDWWDDLYPATYAGWGYPNPVGYPVEPVAHYQAMYCLMKAFEYCQIDTIDLSRYGLSPTWDWFNEFAEVILSQQQLGAGNGYWLKAPDGDWGDTQLNTIWALLVLERIAPGKPLDLEKTDNPDPVYAGGTITYEINYGNSGNNFQVTGVTLIDELPSETTFFSATGGGTYDLGSHTVTWSLPPLNQGDTGSVTLVVRVNPGTADGTIVWNRCEITADDIGPTEYREDTEVMEPVAGPVFSDILVILPIGLIASTMVIRRRRK